MQSWVEEEFAGADLGDRRLNKRLIKIVEHLADKPTASIPGACQDWTETQAAYRFFNQAEAEEEQAGLTMEDVLRPHLQRTRQRMAQHAVVLCQQDTSELDFQGKTIKGLGPLTYEVQRGMYLHPTYAVTPEREPLGLLDVWRWARQPKGPDGARPGDLESERWCKGYERVAELAAVLPNTRLVYVADREADILAVMQRAESLGQPADWLLRSKHNRALPEGNKLWEKVLSTKALGQIEFYMAARKGQAGRNVRQEIRVDRVRLTNGRGGWMWVTCLIATEIEAPEGVEPIEWRLLTNRPIKDLDAAVELINWYRARWEIETFFNVLKNACRVEALQLATMKKVELALALYMVVSWRLARLARFGRTHPDLTADSLFSEEEWKGAYWLAKIPAPTQPPSVREVIRRIAMLGGFLGRKADGEPGVKTLWLGLQRLRDFVEGCSCMKEILGL